MMPGTNDEHIVAENVIGESKSIQIFKHEHCGTRHLYRALSTFIMISLVLRPLVAVDDLPTINAVLNV
jgi:hypothetical protein